MSFLYVIGITDNDNTVKIGYSADPVRRLGELQVGHDKKLHIVYTESVPDHRAPILEEFVHRANRHLRIHGEWFKLTHLQATLEVQFVVIRYLDDDY